jgi:hypothetical protein
MALQEAWAADRLPKLPESADAENEFILAYTVCCAIGRSEPDGMVWVGFLAKDKILGHTVVVEERCVEHAVRVRTTRFDGDFGRVRARLGCSLVREGRAISYVWVLVNDRFALHEQPKGDSGGPEGSHILQSKDHEIGQKRQGAGMTLLQLTKQIFKLLQQLDIWLAVAHIPGKENDLVDALSRLEVTGDYSLRQDVFEAALRLSVATPTIEMFAHNLNCKLPVFVAIDGPLARGAVVVEAFAYNLSIGLPYLFPTVQLLLRVLAKVRDERVRAVIVVPMWLSQPWWTLFQTMQTNTVTLGDAANVLS